MAKRSFLPALLERGSLPAVLPDTPTRTLTEQTYNTLRDDIVEGRLAPGSKLGIEHLRAQHGVGAGTVREALTRLVSDALVTTEGQRGFRVAPIAVEELADITNLRVHIETEALRHSMRQGGAAWREALAQAFAALSGLEPVTPERRQQWEGANVHFHEVLLSGHASAWTLRVLRLLSRHTERYRSLAMTLPGCLRDVHAEHADIYRYALAGHEARAALALEAHIRTTPDLLIAALREGHAILPSHEGSPSSAAGGRNFLQKA